MVAPLQDFEATLLSSLQEVIQYPLATVLTGIQYPLANDKRVRATRMQFTQRLWQPSCKTTGERANCKRVAHSFWSFARGLPWPFDYTRGSCGKPLAKFSAGCHQPNRNLHQGCHKPLVVARGYCIHSGAFGRGYGITSGNI